jgi:hypothetical protein
MKKLISILVLSLMLTFNTFAQKVEIKDLPILECTFKYKIDNPTLAETLKYDADNSSIVETFHLRQIYNGSEFKVIYSDDSEFWKTNKKKNNKSLEMKDGYRERLFVSDDNYRIRYYINKDKVASGFYIDIKKATGVAEIVVPITHVMDGTIQTYVKALDDPLTKTYIGACKET